MELTLSNLAFWPRALALESDGYQILILSFNNYVPLGKLYSLSVTRLLFFYKNGNGKMKTQCRVLEYLPLNNLICYYFPLSNLILTITLGDRHGTYEGCMSYE